MSLSRRSFLSGAAAAAGVATGWPGGSPALAQDQSALSDPGPALRDLAAARGLKIGTAVSPAGFFDSLYQSLLARHFSLVVPDYGGYMTDIRPTPEHWDFWALDQVVAGAVKADQKVRGHALVFGIPPGHDMFGGWTPTSSWVQDAHLSRSAALGVLQE